MDKTQLPAEVLEELGKAAVEAAKKNEGRVYSYRLGYENGHFDCATEYALKLYLAQQEIAELKQWKRETTEIFSPIIEYGQSKEAGISLGKSITETVLQRCKNYDKVFTLLEKFFSYYKNNMLVDEGLYNEIKTFLDGKK